MEDPKNRKNKREKRETDAPQSSSVKSQLYTHEIANAFVLNLEQESQSYMTMPKDELMRKFQEFVRREYGNNTLLALKEGRISGKAIDVELNSILNKGFKLSDLRNPERAKVIEKQFKTTLPEPDAIKESLFTLYRQRQQLPKGMSTSAPFDDFLKLVGYKTTHTPSGELSGITQKTSSTGYSAVTIKKLWREYLRDQGITDDKRIQEYDEMFDISNFDPTEKIACVRATQELDKTIDKLSKGDASTAQQLRQHFKSVFGEITSPLPLTTSWMTIQGFAKALDEWISISGSLIEQEDLKSLDIIKIDMKSCIELGEKEKHWDSGTMQKLQDKVFSQIHTQFQTMANKFLNVDLINGIDVIFEDLEESIEDYTTSFDIPGNMRDFFDQFGTPGQLTNTQNSPEYKKLLLDEETVREKLGSPIVTSEEKDRLEQRLQDIKEQKISLQRTQQALTWDAYFTLIAQQIQQVQQELGYQQLSGSIEKLLLQLQHNNRNIALLSPAEQNIIMQASLSMQLQKAKKSAASATFGVSFEEYAQFIISLYDFSSNHAEIKTKDGETIDLNFTAKRFVGKPLEFQDVNIQDMSSLKNIRIEFELDINNNPRAESLIRAFTGGPHSKVVMDFFGRDSNTQFPDTITDSSLVRMKAKDGTIYEGYLSPYDYRNNNDDLGGTTSETLNDISQSKTFILYSQPADKLHTNRVVQLQKDPSSGQVKNIDGRDVPVFINPNNIHDRESVEILDKKITLSDKHLKGLALGQLIANKLDASDFDNPVNSINVKDAIDGENQQFLDELQEDSRDTITTQTIQEESAVELKSSEFQKYWNELIGNKETPCELGVRLAVKFPDNMNGVSTLKTFPASEQLLSMTVTGIQKDEFGNPIGVTFEFGNLSRMGKYHFDDITLQGAELQKIKSICSQVHYLDKASDAKDYPTVLSRLEKIFATNKQYQWSLFKDLGFNGKEFKKGDEKIVKFLCTEQTVDTDGKKYDVEYKVEYVGNNQYRVRSTPFITPLLGKNKQIKKQAMSFDTTTDLSGMLLILSGKKLQALTQKQQNLREASHPSDGILPEKRYGAGSRWSLNTIWKVLKGGWKDIADQWIKKLEESGQNELKYLLFQENNIYRRLDHMFGGILEAFDMNIFTDLADTAEEEAMGYGFKKIEAVYNHLSKLHKTYNYGGMGNTKIKGGGAQVKEYVDDALNYYNAGRQIPYMIRVKVAAGLRYNLETYKTGYANAMANLQEYPRGTYVRLLFGEHAYQAYEQRYNKLKHELDSATNMKTKSQKQDLLMSLEYEFISHNISGGAQQMDKQVRDNPEARYFQRIYGREYGNKIRSQINPSKIVSTDINNEKIKDLIDGGNFDHIYNEYYGHINGGRAEEAVYELVAMGKIATTSEQKEEVLIALMTGMLNGVLLHNLGATTRMDLKGVFRNNSIPFPHRIERDNGPEMIVEMLRMATANLGTESFDEKFDKSTVLSYSSYEFGQRNGSNGFPAKFAYYDGTNNPRLAPGSIAREQIISFFYMDKKSMQSPNNLINIWKSPNDKLPIIFGHRITQEQKNIVEDMMGELNFNTARTARIDNYNYDAYFHPATTIENFMRDTINSVENGHFKNEIADHANVFYTAVKEDHAPDNIRIQPGEEYKLAYHISEFFRIFSGFGTLTNTKISIETFYKYVRKAQEQKTPRDKRRLMSFYLIEHLYGKGQIPTTALDAMKPYLQYFETNLDNITAQVGRCHVIPEDNPNSFEYVFRQESDLYYIPHTERSKKERLEQNKLFADMDNDGHTLLNGVLDKENRRAKGIRGQQGIVGKSVDDIIEDLLGETGISHDQNNMQTKIDAINNENVNWDFIDPTQKSNLQTDTELVNNYSKQYKKRKGGKSSNDIDTAIDAALEERGLTS